MWLGTAGGEIDYVLWRATVVPSGPVERRDSGMANLPSKMTKVAAPFVAAPVCTHAPPRRSQSNRTASSADQCTFRSNLPRWLTRVSAVLIEVRSLRIFNLRQLHQS